jgi:hypothetical protein
MQPTAGTEILGKLLEPQLPATRHRVTPKRGTERRIDQQPLDQLPHAGRLRLTG